MVNTMEISFYQCLFTVIESNQPNVGKSAQFTALKCKSRLVPREKSFLLTPLGRKAPILGNLKRFLQK